MDWVAVEPQTETEMGLIFPPVWSPVGWERRKTPHTCVNTQHTRHRSQTLVNIKWQLMNWKHTFCIVCYDDHTCSTLRLPFNLYCKFHNQLVLLWLNPFHFAPPSPRGSAILFFFFFFSFFLPHSAELKKILGWVRWPQLKSCSVSRKLNTHSSLVRVNKSWKQSRQLSVAVQT